MTFVFSRNPAIDIFCEDLPVPFVTSFDAGCGLNCCRRLSYVASSCIGLESYKGIFRMYFANKEPFKEPGNFILFIEQNHH